MAELTRRRLLASAGAGAAGIGLAGAAGYLVGSESAEASDGTGTVPFYGEHQAGIATPAQDRLHFAAFDLVEGGRAELRELLRAWSLAAAEMTSGSMVGDVNDTQVAFHAVRNMARIGRGTVVMRWSQLGFGRTASTSRSQDTPRNLMGFKDGTANIRAEDTEAMDRFVWVGSEGPSWMRGGSYLVTRRIRMLLEIWDRSALADQEETIGRDKSRGAPLGGSDEFEPLNLEAQQGGKPVIPVDAHVRLASASMNGGERILRRGYSFTDGVDESLGELEAGLFFICFQRDPRRQFVPIQRQLGSLDSLNEYIKHRR
jgi:deferrochelatase/peroxidase EfeB